MDMPEMTSSGIRHRNISEPSSSVVIERPQHATSLLMQLNAMRSDNNSVDTILIADGTEFPCHRAVLSASSQYFRLMFGGRLRESHERRIMFDGVTALALGRLIDYVYSGQIKMSLVALWGFHFTIDSELHRWNPSEKPLLWEKNCHEENQCQVTVDDAQELLAAACLFQYNEVMEECCRFLSAHLHPTNCLRIEAFAQLHNCSTLAAEARRFAMENFSAVSVDSDEFTEISSEWLEHCIASNDLEVRMEEEVFEAILRWVNADFESRRSLACNLLQHVRYTSIDSDYLTTTVLQNRLIAHCPSCRAFISNTSAAKSSNPRPSTVAKEVMVVIGGYGCNGVPLDSVEAYVPSKDCWQLLTALPTPIVNCGVAAIANDIYVSGGIVQGEIVSTVWRFVSVQQRWISAPALIGPRAYHASAAVGTRLFVIGGRKSGSVTLDDSIINSIECIDTCDSHSCWRVVVTIPYPRWNSDVVAFGTEMLVEVGGCQVGAGVVRTMETYNVIRCSDADRVTYSGEQFVLPDPIQYAQVAAIGTILYIICTDSGRVISLNSERRIFRRLTNMNARHLDGRASVLDGHVYVTGGAAIRDGVSAPSDWVEYYNADANKWTNVRPMLHARQEHCCVTIRMR